MSIERDEHRAKLERVAAKLKGSNRVTTSKDMVKIIVDQTAAKEKVKSIEAKLKKHSGVVVIRQIR